MYHTYSIRLKTIRQHYAILWLAVRNNGNGTEIAWVAKSHKLLLCKSQIYYVAFLKQTFCLLLGVLEGMEELSSCLSFERTSRRVQRIIAGFPGQNWSARGLIVLMLTVWRLISCGSVRSVNLRWGFKVTLLNLVQGEELFPSGYNKTWCIFPWSHKWAKVGHADAFTLLISLLFT